MLNIRAAEKRAQETIRLRRWRDAIDTARDFLTLLKLYAEAIHVLSGGEVGQTRKARMRVLSKARRAGVMASDDERKRRLGLEKA